VTKKGLFLYRDDRKWPANGTAAWLEDKHLRVNLIDLGYIDPGDPDVEIKLQNISWIRSIYILTNNELPIHKNNISLRIHMDTFVNRGFGAKVRRDLIN
jgi:hypothetical protein